MNITKDMDPFDVFHIDENATDEEIKAAFKFHVDMYCGEDGNKQNRDGEYLINIYHEHFKRLMDKEEREKLIEARKLRRTNSTDITLPDSYETALVVSKNFQEKQKYMITSMNQEIIQRYSEIEPKRTFSLKKHSLKNTYIVVGEDCSLLFSNKRGGTYIDAKRENSETGKKEVLKDAEHYTLYECFTGQNIFGAVCFPWFNLPWSDGKIFWVQGVKSIAFLASKIFPPALIHHRKVRDCDFRQTYDIIFRYLNQNSDYVASLFEDADEEDEDKDEKENKKQKKKK